MLNRFIGIALCMIFLAASAGARERSVQFAIQPQRNLPVTVEILEGNRILKSSDTISIGDNGFDGLTFAVTNTSGKTIRHISIEVAATSNGEKYLIPSNYGPQTEAQPVRNLENPIKPGERVEIRGKKMTDQFKKSMGDFTEVEVGVGFVIFDDKTAWRAGRFLRQDETNPLRWIPIANQK